MRNYRFVLIVVMCSALVGLNSRAEKENVGMAATDATSPDGLEVQLDNHNDSMDEMSVEEERVNLVADDIKNQAKESKQQAMVARLELKKAREKLVKAKDRKREVYKVADITITENRERRKVALAEKKYLDAKNAQLQREIRKIQERIDNTRIATEKANVAATESRKRLEELSKQRTELLEAERKEKAQLYKKLSSLRNYNAKQKRNISSSPSKRLPKKVFKRSFVKRVE